METLRIKCPSCGIVLEVRNSKNEKVKKITCPNCQKQLAITFGDMAAPVGSLYEGTTRYQLNEGANAIPGIPSGLVELRVVRLKDGTPKHILRALTGEQKVSVNGQSLMQDDEVVLQRGDDLRIEAKSFSFDKPGESKPQPSIAKSHQEVKPEPKPQQKPEPKPEPKPKKTWLLSLLAVVAGILLVLFLWPVNKTEQPKEEAKDSIVEISTKVIKEKEKDQRQPVKQETKKDVQPEKKTSDLTSMDLYSLELLANKNDVSAQYELGQRLIRSSGSKNVVLGLNWLHKASLNGSSQARQLKSKAVRSLQTKAAQGDSIAYYILNSIDR